MHSHLPPTAAAHVGARLLVVDDHTTAREGLMLLLSEEGYECLTAADGEEALKAISTQPLDLVLLDINMPGMSGLAVLESVRQTKNPTELPIIMVTARDAPENVVTALRLGANDYVAKPIQEHVLVARIETQLQLRELSRMKDRFLSIASHDLKNPLTVTRMAAELLRNALPDTLHTQETNHLLDLILRGTARMRRLVSDFLDMGTLEAGRFPLKKEPMDLRQLAAEVVQDSEGMAREKGIDLAVETAAAPAPTRMDPERFTQVVDNLVGNALKFSPRGARVRLRTYRTESAAGLEVRDTGPGLKPEDFSHLFEKYARLSNRPTGGERSSGLGLYICKLLVEQHGGRMGARNAEGGGAVFWLELPLHAP
jgi:signal transduction histidine kinase